MRLFICFALILLATSCTKKEADTRKIVVDVNEIQESIPISQIFDSLAYIPLETTKESLFKQIDKLRMDRDGNFYILDKKGVNAIYKFDKQGRFQARIGYSGKGPREYMEITDFCLYGDTIVEIYDAGKQKRMQYTASGKFIREENGWKMGGASFIHLGDTVAFYASCGGYAPNLNVYVNGEKHGFFKQDYPELRSKWEYFHADGSNLYYSDNYNDTLYCFRAGRMEPYFYVDFWDHKLPKEIREMYKAHRGGFCHDFDNVKFTSRYIYFTFGYKGTEIQVFFDKMRDSVCLIESFENDIDEIPFLVKTATPGYPDKIVTYLNVNMFSVYYKNFQRQGKEIPPMYEILAKQVTENSNPVIVFAYIKK